jgi:uncharacterized RDD family membrane protein YckC
METPLGRAEPSPAGFWIRVAASVIDYVVFLVVEFVLGVAAGLVWGREIVDLPLFKATVWVFMLVFGIAYLAVLHAIGGQTVGKLLVRVRVTALNGRTLTFGVALLRALAWLLSLLSLGLGFIVVGVRRDKRALHDLIAGTRVVHLS